MHIIETDGIKHYFTDKWVHHRLDGPAIDGPNHKEWLINGKHHRADGPAIEASDRREWYVNGKRHRTDGPAIEFNDGTFEYHYNGETHREDGPAIRQFKSVFEDPENDKYNFIQTEEIEEIFVYKGKYYRDVTNVTELMAEVMAEIIET